MNLKHNAVFAEAQRSKAQSAGLNSVAHCATWQDNESDFVEKSES